MKQYTVVLEAYKCGKGSLSDSSIGYFWLQYCCARFSKVILITNDTNIESSEFENLTILDIQNLNVSRIFKKFTFTNKVKNMVNYMFWLMKSMYIFNKNYRNKENLIFIHASLSNSFIGTFNKTKNRIICGTGFDYEGAYFDQYLGITDRIRRFIIKKLHFKFSPKPTYYLISNKKTVESKSRNNVYYFPDGHLDLEIIQNKTFHNVTKNKYQITLVSSHFNKKGTDIVIDALSNVEKFNNILIHNFGPITIDHPSVINYGITDRDTYLKSLSVSSYLLFPSYREGVSTTLLECLYYKKICICFKSLIESTGLKSNAAIVIEEQTSPDKDLFATLNKIDKSNGIIYDELGDEGHRFYNLNFSEEAKHIYLDKFFAEIVFL